MTTPLPSRLRESARELRDSGTTQDSLDWREIRDRSVARIAAELAEAADALEAAANKPTRDDLGTLLVALRFGQYNTENDYQRLLRAIDIALAGFDIANARFAPPSAQVAQEGAAGVKGEGNGEAL